MSYIQHNPWVAENLTGLLACLAVLAKGDRAVTYTNVRRVLGEVNFVLVAQGRFGEKPTAFYDFYRIQNGKLAGHRDARDSTARRVEKRRRQVLSSVESPSC